MDDIVNKACECLTNIPDTLDTQQYNMELGLCILEASSPYKKKLKKDFDIDLDKIDTEGESLGRLIGVRMTTVCPDALISISKRSAQKKLEKEPLEISDLGFEKAHGFITNIEDDYFVVFSVKDENGKITKFYWLTFIDSSIELTQNYDALVGKTANISYEEMEFFDPKISEYRTFNVIKELLLLDE